MGRGGCGSRVECRGLWVEGIFQRPGGPEFETLGLAGITYIVIHTCTGTCHHPCMINFHA